MFNPLTASRITEAMNDINIKQRELANLSGVSESSISQYVNGAHAPSNDKADALADVLGVNPVWLMGHDVPKYKEVHEIDLSTLNKGNLDRLLSYYKYLMQEQEGNEDETT